MWYKIRGHFGTSHWCQHDMKKGDMIRSTENETYSAAGTFKFSKGKSLRGFEGNLPKQKNRKVTIWLLEPSRRFWKFIWRWFLIPSTSFFNISHWFPPIAGHNQPILAGPVVERRSLRDGTATKKGKTVKMTKVVPCFERNVLLEQRPVETPWLFRVFLG